MPTARSGTGIAALDGKIYVLGGEGWVDDFGGVFRANEVYVRAPILGHVLPA